MIKVRVYRFQNTGNQFLSQQLTLFINVCIATTREINTLKRAGSLLTGFINLSSTNLPRFVDKECLSRLQFFNFLHRHIECCLNHRTFRCQNSYFIILIPESRTDPPRITNSERLTTSGQSADNISPIPLFTGRTQHIGKIDMLFNKTGDAHSRLPFRFCKIKEAFYFPIETMPYLFEHNISIGIFARMLSDSCNTGKNLIHIRHIEITAKGQVLGTPVVPSQKRMNIRNTGFSGGRVSQMSHIHFTGKGQGTFGKISIVQLFRGQIFKIALYGLKNLSNGTRS